MVLLCEKIFLVVWRAIGEECEFFVVECAWSYSCHRDISMHSWRMEFDNAFVIAGEEVSFGFICVFWYDCDGLVIVVFHPFIWLLLHQWVSTSSLFVENILRTCELRMTREDYDLSWFNDWCFVLRVLIVCYEDIIVVMFMLRNSSFLVWKCMKVNHIDN